MTNRKLQGEIDRVLKKVDEGVQVFEQTWDKVYSAATSAQKEKYEGDLKKEIKKLQRLRDQIKTWQGDSSIKDKSKLDSNRKLIEEKMEKFKICEKETKTKAFSKEGLMQDRTDPKQKQKAEIVEWVGDAIRKIQEQNEEMESEIESMSSGRRRKRGTTEDPKVTELKNFTIRNEKHIGMLERVLRALDNDAITPEEVIELKDSVEYYVESNQDPDFYEDDEMYADLNLDSVPTPIVNVNARKPRDEDSNNGGSGDKSSTPTNTDDKGSKNKSKVVSPKVPSSASKARGTKRTNVAAINLNVPSPAKKQPIQSPIINGHHHTTSTAGQPPAVQSPRVKPGGPLMSSVVKSGSAAAAAANVGTKDTVVRQIFKQKQHGNINPTSAATSFAEPLSKLPQQLPTSTSNTQMRWNGVVARNSNPPHSMASPTRAAGADNRIIRNTVAGATSSDGMQQQPQQNTTTTTSIHEEMELYEPSEQELMAQSKALSGAARSLPSDWFGHSSFDNNPQDSTRAGITGTSGAAANAHNTRNPVNVPASFPQIPASVFEKANIFLKFDPDTLFFIFYYQQGTLQQYLAAKELKRQGWRFHKKYLTWFQRHDEPKVVNDEYETGTFIYFDYANVVFRGQGSGWCQRIKSEFVFEYRYLEADDD